ncbi:hypothetical protein QR680_017987 [Steinernema hermaphroditum]|uniref:Uncharacterized protein n=1 Tax=Steinernema hermaphroditum TaxID=289476 RepID=A0AA39HGI9_9BILA|nr:hypothetical protein QR680_017987 [Steinernema hermaphroditum]
MSPSNDHVFVGHFDFCDLGEQMSNSIHFRLIMVFRMIVCFFGILLCGVLLLSKLNTVILHVHARVLIKYHIVITFLLATNYLWVSIFEIVRYSRNVPSCDYLMPRWLSFFPHFITGNLIYCQILSCFMMTVERLICTFKIRTYENINHENKIRFALILMTGAVVVASYFSIATTANWNVKLFYLSFKDGANFYYAIGYIFLQFCLDLVTVVICKVVDVVNTRTREKFVNGTFFLRRNFLQNQLSSKLQIRENIALSHTLMPIVAIHFFFTACSALIISVVMVALQRNIILAILVAESSSLFPIYSVVMPLLFFRKHRSLFWDMAEKVCKRKFRNLDVRIQKSEGEFDQHFKWFDRMLENKQMPTQL